MTFRGPIYLAYTRTLYTSCHPGKIQGLSHRMLVMLRSLLLLKPNNGYAGKECRPVRGNSNSMDFSTL